MKTKLLAAAAVVAIIVVGVSAGCAGLRDDPQKAIIASCQVAQSSLTALTLALELDKLSLSQAEQVDAFVPTYRRICVDGRYDDAGAALTAIQTGLTELALIQGDR